MLHQSLHNSIYGIYGFVRLADEIVDSFHGYEKKKLLDQFEKDTYAAIEDKISLNPVLHSFQEAVNTYQIPLQLIDTFLASMRMDLDHEKHDQESFETYILGSAEVVGLMCLKVFVNGDAESYQRLKPAAMKLGSAFQKVNFLRDLAADFDQLGRSYFPGIDLANLNTTQKEMIEASIQADFDAALEGIRQLPRSARFGVYTAYIYYLNLFRKIKQTPVDHIMRRRIRISNQKKLFLLIKSYFTLNLKFS
jgi:phytoene/squalene synthetase